VHRLTAVPAARGSFGWGAGMAAYLAPADSPGSSTAAHRPTRYQLGVVAADTAPGTHPPPAAPSHAPRPVLAAAVCVLPAPPPPRPVLGGPVALRGLSAPSVWVLGSGSFISTKRLQTAFSIWELKGSWQMAHLQRRARAYFVPAYYPSVCGPAIRYHSNSRTWFDCVPMTRQIGQSRATRSSRAGAGAGSMSPARRTTNPC
jgi:hypothetical protein